MTAPQNDREGIWLPVPNLESPGPESDLGKVGSSGNWPGGEPMVGQL